MKATINIREILEEKIGETPTIPATIDIGEVFDFTGTGEDHDIDIHDLLAEHRAIALIWDADQVLSHYPHLTEDQAWAVLQECERNYKGEEGLCWDDIAETIQEMHPDPKERLAERVGRFGRTVAEYNGDWPETDNLMDLLADARHWCDAKELDFSRINGTAYEHYLAERDGKE